MELGLSLGETSKPCEAPPSNNLGSGFWTTLSIGPISTNTGEEAKDQKLNHTIKLDEETNESHSLSPKSKHLFIQHELLPDISVVHVNPLSNLSLRWPSSENGSSAGVGSSKGLDVNMLPAAGEEEAEECQGLSSSPNSDVSSFQMGLCVYNKGGNNIIGGSVIYGKRDLSDGEAYDNQRASSRASDEDDNVGSTRKKLRLSKEQSAFLEESFKEHHTLNPKQKLALAKQLNLRPRQVEVWFQNRRARTKLKQTEVDCEYMKRFCETLTEENMRLHKELQELRALKTSSPFSMQLPATTLTMCPSCEQIATNSAFNPSTSPSTSKATGFTTSAKGDEPNSKAVGFPLSRARFYKFIHTQSHPHKSTEEIS
ncbi:Homeobox associated leucine zipper protein [Quillaja saponaria]|uniref:Homeobox associated leucine zipper protein n=1 Tax=Quillaja saponaria TaxID=32244 RepID=A0AAD7VNH0_QUISA|nr:Homeobox associated leucine zipper protein [Quillaja saponaria]